MVFIIIFIIFNIFFIPYLLSYYFLFLYIKCLIPEFGGERPPKLTKEQKEKLKKILKEKDSWTTKEVKKLIKGEFGVKYSAFYVRRILKSFA
ncbi:winged helix-turn-helix domain-containing protein [Methanothermococcus sp. SCGC AD-155-M21]|nr:winged helix-turn-helix domain-containing protein [Methanothermococcus sp. SCGC AD-155-M21]